MNDKELKKHLIAFTRGLKYNGIKVFTHYGVNKMVREYLEKIHDKK